MLQYFVYSTVLTLCLIHGGSARDPFVANVLRSMKTPEAACPPTCKDTIPDCLTYLNRCLDPNFYAVMKLKCPCTCLLCDVAGVQTSSTTTAAPVTTTAPICVDKNTTECERVYYECKDEDYKPLMCKYCPKTCNFCNDPCMHAVGIEEKFGQP